MYDKGYVGATQNLRGHPGRLNTWFPPSSRRWQGFPTWFSWWTSDLLEVLTEWNKMPTVEPYVKLDITRYLTIISKLREQGLPTDQGAGAPGSQHPFDETEEPLRGALLPLPPPPSAGEALPQPELPQEGPRTLPDLELYCRKLDLYFSFAKSLWLPGG